MSNEKNINSSHEKVFDSESLMQEAHERNRGLAAERERNAAERSSEDLESARREALERAARDHRGTQGCRFHHRLGPHEGLRLPQGRQGGLRRRSD